MFEVEKRVFLNLEKLEELKKFLANEGTFKSTFKRFTLVSVDREDFLVTEESKNNPLDVRIRSTGENSKVTVKYGNWHNDQGRQESELPIKTDDFMEAVTMLKLMGHNYFCTTYIERFTYEYKGFEITLDKYFTSDKCLMEIELLVDSQEETKAAEQRIRNLISEIELVECNANEFVEFVQSMNLNPNNQLNLKKDDLQSWYKKWEEYIYCRI